MVVMCLLRRLRVLAIYEVRSQAEKANIAILMATKNNEKGEHERHH